MNLVQGSGFSVKLGAGIWGSGFRTNLDFEVSPFAASKLALGAQQLNTEKPSSCPLLLLDEFPIPPQLPPRRRQRTFKLIQFV